VTVHRAQGLTLESCSVDLGPRAFAHGQTYVAVSRCRRLEGLSLTRRLEPKDLIVHPRVREFLSASAA
jgi:ATP-dependent DNA helicase PIF1